MKVLDVVKAVKEVATMQGINPLDALNPLNSDFVEAVNEVELLQLRGEIMELPAEVLPEVFANASDNARTVLNTMAMGYGFQSKLMPTATTPALENIG